MFLGPDVSVKGHSHKPKSVICLDLLNSTWKVKQTVVIVTKREFALFAPVLFRESSPPQ